MEMNCVISINFCDQERPQKLPIKLLVVVFHKLKENRKSDDDDAVHKLCSQSSQSIDTPYVK